MTFVTGALLDRALAQAKKNIAKGTWTKDESNTLFAPPIEEETPDAEHPDDRG